MKRIVLMMMMYSTAANAQYVKIPWKGDYAHNSAQIWSRDNPWDSGFSRNFLNGTPEEGGKVQKEGELKGELWLPPRATGPVPMMIVMHGCTGLADLIEKLWERHVMSQLLDEGIGVFILDSFATRGVVKTCGMPDFHWGRRRADDAYSALAYLVENKIAKPAEVYLMGQSNGGLATMIAMSDKESDHEHKFTAAFPIVPSCINTPVKYGDYVRPMIIFAGDQDDANPSKHCVEMMKKKRATPIQLIVYKDANHGFMEDFKARTIYGWTDSHGTVHNWTLSYNPTAEKDMMQTIISAIKTKKFVKGIEFR